jgi:hypothetical protein
MVTRFNSAKNNIIFFILYYFSKLCSYVICVRRFSINTDCIICTNSKRFTYSGFCTSSTNMSYGYPSVTGVIPFDAMSFNSRARVSDSSSHGLITHCTPFTSSFLLFSTNFTLVVVSGTLLIHTKIFIDYRICLINGSFIVGISLVRCGFCLNLLFVWAYKYRTKCKKTAFCLLNCPRFCKYLNYD